MELIVPHYKYYESYKMAYTVDVKHKINYYNFTNFNGENDFNSFLVALSKINYFKVYWLVDKGEFIGEGALFLEEKENAVNWEIGYAISPFKRNKGYGNKILFYLLEEAKKHDLKEVYLNVAVTNNHSNNIVKNNKGQFLYTKTLDREISNYYKIKL